MGQNIEAVNWYAVHTRLFKERAVADCLAGKDYPIVFPTYMGRRVWADRDREVERPLFPGYVFARFRADHRLPILVTPGVIQIVSAGKVPTPVDENEIAAIQALMVSGAHAQPWPFLNVGQSVVIQSGPLRNLEGVLIEFKKKHRLVISVTLLRRSIAVEVDRMDIQPILSSRTAVPLGESSKRSVKTASA